MSSELQSDVRYLNRWRRHQVNAYEVKAGMVFIAGKTVWSMPERFKVVCMPCKALYKCSALPLPLPLTFIKVFYDDDDDSYRSVLWQTPKLPRWDFTRGSRLLSSLQQLRAGFPLYFGIKIQGLFKDFQGPWGCIFKDQFSTEVYSKDSIKATCNIYFYDYGTVLVHKNKTWQLLANLILGKTPG